MPEPAPSDDDLPLPLVLVVTSVLTVLLSVWAAFLVPLRVGVVPVPVSLLLLGAVVVLGVLAGRSAGWPGALLLALLWVAVTLPLSVPRREGDLVVQGVYGSTAVGLAYLGGGVVLWSAVVSGALHRTSPRRPGRR